MIAIDQPGDLLYLGYLLLFGIGALLCFVSLARVKQVENRDTRIGLAALLIISGTWSVGHLGYLAAPTEGLRHGFYLLGLVVGLSAVGPWLYFCSAYTGRSLHQNRRIRWTAVIIYLGIVSVKLTNPIHQFYYVTEPVTQPFPHLQITHQSIHWLVMGLAYALATIGFFMLFELFYKTDYDVTPLAGLVALTALPVGLDIAGSVSPLVLELTYSPLGVAAFSTGVMFVYADRFQTLQIAGEGEDPVVILDDDDTVREANRKARELFPQLEEEHAIGRSLREVLPKIAEIAIEERPVIEREIGGETRYYQVSPNPFTAGQAEIGRVLTFADVTESERYRRELERQNERLETFASMVSHDLRNPLTVAKGHLEIVRAETDDEDLETVAAALDRMNDLIEDVLQLARQGQPIEETEPVDLGAVAERSWEMIESIDAELLVADTPEIEGDPERLQQLLENLFRNAIEHGGVDVTVRIGALDRGGFYIEDDGPGIPEDDREEVFGSGFTTNEEGTGFGLAIVEEIVDAHGWTIRTTESRDGGARFEIGNVTRAGGE
jgi:signal transduction histidine kinase